MLGSGRIALPPSENNGDVTQRISTDRSTHFMLDNSLTANGITNQNLGKSPLENCRAACSACADSCIYRWIDESRLKRTLT
jgi:hypothetical protein